MTSKDTGVAIGIRCAKKVPDEKLLSEKDFHNAAIAIEDRLNRARKLDLNYKGGVKYWTDYYAGLTKGIHEVRLERVVRVRKEERAKK